MFHIQGEAKKVQYTTDESALGQNDRALVIKRSRLLDNDYEARCALKFKNITGPI
jgi:hypothetical protein